MAGQEGRAPPSAVTEVGDRRDEGPEVRHCEAASRGAPLRTVGPCERP
ncbi:hypothetical protein TOK_2548 [Pseudonocardia sp. N23]|nr:hypothetical protein TOK_2548 [Pseudonocardia sp. N23]